MVNQVHGFLLRNSHDGEECFFFEVSHRCLAKAENTASSFLAPEDPGDLHAKIGHGTVHLFPEDFYERVRRVSG